MNPGFRSGSMRAVLLALALAIGVGSVSPAHATRQVPEVTGTVTSLPGGASIAVNGTIYSVSVSGPALTQLQQVSVGETVDLVLSGPPGAPSTQVVAIYEHTSQ